MLESNESNKGAVFPNTFLGAYVPRLQILELFRIQYPGLPILLLSATHLVHLSLYDRPFLEYIPPEVIVSSLSTLTSLESFTLETTGSRWLTPPTKHQPLSTRTVLPALTHFSYTGFSRNLEDYVALIDCPKLNNFLIDFVDESDCDTPQLDYFISRTPSLQAPENAPHVTYI